MTNNFNSDIFNAYAKIAEEQGLVSTSEVESDKSKKILEKNPRTDSLTQERIAKLYNVVTDAPKDMGYKRNMGEVAHKEPVVIAPAYDKLNALVESDNERQDILLHIVNKRTNGLLTQHKYAQDELIRTLVKIANHMDNIDQTDITKLADECLEGFKKKSDFNIGKFFSDLVFHPPAAARPIIGGLKGAALGGLIAVLLPEAALPALIIRALPGLFSAGAVFGNLLLGMGPRVISLNENCDLANKAIKDLINTKTLSQISVNKLNKLIKQIDLVKSKADSFYKELENASSMNNAQLMDKKEDIKQIDQEFSDQIHNLKDMIDQYNEYKSTLQTEYDSKKTDILVRMRDYGPFPGIMNDVLSTNDAVDSLNEEIDQFLGVYESGITAAAAKAKRNLDKAKSKLPDAVEATKNKFPELSEKMEEWMRNFNK